MSATDCSQCVDGTLEQVESGFYECGTCGAVVAPELVETPESDGIL